MWLLLSTSSIQFKRLSYSQVLLIMQPLLTLQTSMKAELLAVRWSGVYTHTHSGVR